jgi:PadR family transcriptional regulator, regulatory protein PadR
MARDDLQLLQGTLDVLVLKTLSWGPRHGYEIARWIRDATDAELQVEDRALYVSLHRMEERGWLECEWGMTENNRKAKYYQLTPEGRQQLVARRASGRATRPPSPRSFRPPERREPWHASPGSVRSSGSPPRSGRWRATSRTRSPSTWRSARGS